MKAILKSIKKFLSVAFYFPKIPSAKFQLNDDKAKAIVARLSRGNISLQMGLYITKEEQDRLLDELNKN